MSTPPEQARTSWALVDRSSRKRRRQSSEAQEAASAETAVVVEKAEPSRHSNMEGIPSQPLQDFLDAPIPTYEEAALAFTTSNEQDTADMLLAVQLTLVDSDGEDIDVTNFDPVLRHQLLGIPIDSNTVFQPLQNEQEDETAHESTTPSLPEYSNEDHLPKRSSRPRDRYDVAGIDTYRVDPRGTHSLYRRFRQVSGNMPQVASPSSTESRDGAESVKPSPLNPGSFFEAVRKRHPILNPTSGAPMVNVLHRDSFLLVLDYLYFPDIFALAMTCKAVHASIDLESKKRQYRKALLSQTQLCDGAGAHGSPSRSGLCKVCLYELPHSYFKKPRESHGQGGEASSSEKDERKRPKREPSVICNDCVEFRERLKAAKGNDGGSSNSNNVWMVWRPNQRVTVDGTGGFLWYRRRV